MRQRARGVVVAVVAATLALALPASQATARGATGPAEAALPQITGVAAGQNRACALSSDGAIRCWGTNQGAALGTGDSRPPVGDEPGEMGDALVAVDLGDGHHALAVDTGGDTTCALREDGRVKCWGINADGQLGLGDTSPRGFHPSHMGDVGLVDLGPGRTAIQVAVGTAHVCALLDDATVKCWGDNERAQLGQGDTFDRGNEPGEMGDTLRPVDLGPGRTATTISTGAYHTCALLDDATVKCWGDNDRGQLGQGDTFDRGDEPGEMGDTLHAVDLGSGRTATAISAGAHHTCALLDDATVKCWGDNQYGALGQGDTARRGDEVGEMGDALPPVDLGSGATVTAVSAGYAVSCALLAGGHLRCWGANDNGELGLGDRLARGDGPGEMGDALPDIDLGTGRTATAVAVSLGTPWLFVTGQVCALLDDTTVKCWGWNYDGALGQGDEEHRGDDPGEMGDALPPIDLGLLGRPGARLVVSQAAERPAAVAGQRLGFTVTMTNAGTEPVTGIAVTAPALPGCQGAVPDLAPGETQVIECELLLTSADVGTLTSTVEVTSQEAPTVQAPGLDVVVQPYPDEPRAVEVAAGGSHSCARFEDGSVRCWGANDFGQLGQGDTVERGSGPGQLGDLLPPIDLGTGRTATAISAATNHTCALLDNGQVKCWGANYVGQLGLGDTFTRGYNTGQMGDALPAVDLGTGRTAVAITTGGTSWVDRNTASTCALLDDGTVKCWGGNDQGQAGQGHQDAIGDEPGEMGDQLPPVALGTGRTATAVDAGYRRACAVRDDGSLVCWGNLDGTVSGTHRPDDAIGDDPGEMGDALVPVNLGPGRTARWASAGFAHACAVLDDASVKCWGANNAGQLGLGNTTSLGRTTPLADDHPTTDLGTGRTAAALTTGGHRTTCAILDDASLRCWGSDASGVLGRGQPGNLGDQPGEMGDDLAPVDLGWGRSAVDVDLGDFHACAVLDDGTVKCWGENEHGQLGQGDVARRGDGPRDMGDFLRAIDLGTVAPAPALAIAKAADQDAVAAGEPIDYHLTVTNTGNVELTGVTLVDPGAPECDADLGVLPQGAQTVVDCTYTPTAADAGTFTNVATADSDQTDPVDSAPVDVTVTLTHQPDLALKLAGRAFVGGDTYGRHGDAQSVDATRRRSGRATFYLRIENDGAVADTFDLRRIGTSPGVRVRFFRGRTATDLTATVVARTYRTRSLTPGASVLIRVEATVSASAAPGTRTITLRSRSGTEPTRLDTVAARLTVR